MGRVDPGYYFVTSAPQIVRGRIILGGWVTDGQFVGEPSGVVRAFDAVSGRLSWAFDIGHPHRRGAPPEGESYTPGSPTSRSEEHPSELQSLMRNSYAVFCLKTQKNY